MSYLYEVFSIFRCTSKTFLYGFRNLFGCLFVNMQILAFGCGIVIVLSLDLSSSHFGHEPNVTRHGEFKQIILPCTYFFLGLMKCVLVSGNGCYLLIQQARHFFIKNFFCFHETCTLPIGLPYTYVLLWIVRVVRTLMPCTARVVTTAAVLTKAPALKARSGECSLLFIHSSYFLIGKTST